MHDCYDRLKKIVQEKETTDEKAKAINLFFDRNPDCQYDYTLQEIADLLGISRERVRQIESGVFKKLRHPKFGRDLLKILVEFE